MMRAVFLFGCLALALLIVALLFFTLGYRPVAEIQLPTL